MNCKNKNHSCNSCGEKKCGNKHTTCHNADVVRHGYWKHGDEYDDEYICSNCGQLAPLSICQIHEFRTKYCPSCGAKMDGESEGDK